MDNPNDTIRDLRGDDAWDYGQGAKCLVCGSQYPGGITVRSLISPGGIYFQVRPEDHCRAKVGRNLKMVDCGSVKFVLPVVGHDTGPVDRPSLPHMPYEEEPA